MARCPGLRKSYSSSGETRAHGEGAKGRTPSLRANRPATPSEWLPETTEAQHWFSPSRPLHSSIGFESERKSLVPAKVRNVAQVERGLPADENANTPNALLSTLSFRHM